MVQKMIIYKTDYRTFSSAESSNYPSLEGGSDMMSKPTMNSLLSMKSKTRANTCQRTEVFAQKTQAPARLTVRNDGRVSFPLCCLFSDFFPNRKYLIFPSS